MPRLQLLLLLASLGHAHVLQPRDHISSTPLRGRADGYDSDSVEIDANAANHNEDFFRFVTRPDIDAPRWNIRKYDEAAMAPGYWFAAPYQDVIQKERGGGWVGPHIYDQDGELVWSGVPMLNGFNAFDFKVSQYDGENSLSMIYRHDNGLVLNSNYQLEKKYDIADRVGQINMHDFSTAGEGETVLMLKTKFSSASEETLEAAGLDYECRVHWYGFEEVEAETGDPLFSWWAEGKIGLEETFFARRPKRACHKAGGLDAIHANALDKFPDGDYLLSARHTNTLYKISARDGSVVWRFGGRKSDFKWDGHFTGQHHARVRSQNETHTLVSFMDNAYLPAGDPKYSNDCSRGFLVALRTDQEQMTAETVAQFDHPHGGYAPGRGSYQILPNGNTFMGWTSFGLHSEYDVDGKLIMEASLRPELKSYRSYKFPWVGHPTEPPAVSSVAVETDNNSTITTSVHVSWNGATEVLKWNLYKTKATGKSRQLLFTVPRRGFETSIAWMGYAGHVVLEAIDRNGKPLGESAVTATIAPANAFHPEVVEEDLWQQESDSPSISDASASTTQPQQQQQQQQLMFGLPIALGNFGLAFAFGVICCAVGSAACFFLWRLRRSVHGSGPKWGVKNKIYEKARGRDEGEDTLVEEDGGDEDEEAGLIKKGVDSREGSPSVDEDS